MLGMQRKAFDILFNETGIEGEDFVASVKRLNMKEDEEFKALSANAIKSFNEWVDEQKAKGEAAAKERMAASEEAKGAAATQ